MVILLDAGTREPASSRMTDFILRDYTVRLEIGQEEFPGSKRSMYSYKLTYSAGTREPASSRMTDFILRDYTVRVEIGREEFPGSKRSTYGYKLTYSRL